MITRDAIQSDAISAIVAERRCGRKSTLLQMPTQVGKTRTVCKYIARAVAEWDARVLVCCHMGELLDQWARELDAMGIKYRVEKAGQKALDWMRIDPSIRVCLGSKDTLQDRGRSNRLASWPRDWFTDIAIDECHLSTAETFKNVANHFSAAFRVGLTATIDRMDGVPLSTVFESTAYCYPITEAIKNGHRVPFRVVTVDSDIDIRGIKANARGELNPGELASRIGPKLADLVNVVRERFLSLPAVRKAIVFLPTVPLAQLFADLMTQVGLSARSVDGDDPARAVKIREHREGAYPLLVNQKLLGMGYNDPGVGAVIDLSPTRSRAWLDQKAGRCGATAPGKEAGYLVYAGWECDPDLIGPTDIFATDDSARVKTLARKLSRVAKDIDPQAVVEKAREVVAEEDRRERARAERASRFEAKRRDVRHRYSEYDPIGVVSRHAPQVAELLHAPVPIAPGTAARLRDIGMTKLPDVSDHAAAEVARFWEDRRACGMASLKEFLYLTRAFKVPPSRVIDMTSAEAGRAIAERRQSASH